MNTRKLYFDGGISTQLVLDCEVGRKAAAEFGPALKCPAKFIRPLHGQNSWY
jgi:hypothetical protein